MNGAADIYTVNIQSRVQLNSKGPEAELYNTTIHSKELSRDKLMWAQLNVFRMNIKYLESILFSNY